MNRIVFHDSHAYPGCLVSVTSQAVPGNIEAATAFFDDGAMATAQCEFRAAGEFAIQVDAYTTRKGTQIRAKSWLVRHHPDQDSWKVIRRL